MKTKRQKAARIACTQELTLELKPGLPPSPSSEVIPNRVNGRLLGVLRSNAPGRVHIVSPTVVHT